MLLLLLTSIVRLLCAQLCSIHGMPYHQAYHVYIVHVTDKEMRLREDKKITAVDLTWGRVEI